MRREREKTRNFWEVWERRGLGEGGGLEEGEVPGREVPREGRFEV